MGGLTVLETSAVPRRDPGPQVPSIARPTWTDGPATQQNAPVTYNGVPYMFSADEAVPAASNSSTSPTTLIRAW
jgi:hypothetical protein